MLIVTLPLWAPLAMILVPLAMMARERGDSRWHA